VYRTIDYYSKEYNDQSLIIKDHLSAYFDSLCHQLDPDHLVIRAEIGKSDGDFDSATFLEFMKESLKKKGSYYVQDSICRLWGRTKFTVCDLNPIEFGLERFAKYWTTERGVQSEVLF